MPWASTSCSVRSLSGRAPFTEIVSEPPGWTGEGVTVRVPPPGMPAVDGWHQDGPASYVLAVSESAVAAPAATRALVAAGADVLSISESHHSLEDVYLELIDEDNEAGRR